MSECHWKGRKHTPETIQKMIDAKVGHGIGEDNSNFGRHWVSNHKTKQSYLVTESELSDELRNDDITLGRSMNYPGRYDDVNDPRIQRATERERVATEVTETKKQEAIRLRELFDSHGYTTMTSFCESDLTTKSAEALRKFWFRHLPK